MKIYTTARVYDVQHDAALGFIVMCGGKLVRRGTRGYELAVYEFKRLQEDAKYAALYGPDA